MQKKTQKKHFFIEYRVNLVQNTPPCGNMGWSSMAIAFLHMDWSLEGDILN